MDISRKCGLRPSCPAGTGTGLSAALLGFASERFKVEGNPIVDQINDLLPQTQCGQCGHPGCRPTLKPLPMVNLLINALPVGKQPLMPRRSCWIWSRWSWMVNMVRKNLPWSLIFGKMNVSAAPNVFRPARWMPSSGPPSRCIL